MTSEGGHGQPHQNAWLAALLSPTSLFVVATYLITIGAWTARQDIRLSDVERYVEANRAAITQSLRDDATRQRTEERVILRLDQLQRDLDSVGRRLEGLMERTQRLRDPPQRGPAGGISDKLD